MKRREFLKTAAAGGVATAASQTVAAPAIAQGRIKWKMVTCWPKNFPALGTGAQRIADSITAMSDGRLTVKLYASGELVPAFEVFDYVRGGNAELGHDAPYYWINKHSATPFFCSVPGGLTAQEHSAWIHAAGGQALWDELYEPFGLRAFLAGSGGPNMSGWFGKPIETLEDFKGLKMRIPGLGAEVMSRLGATPVNLPGGEILPSLSTGALDATEWAGPYNDLAFGFHKVTKYYYGPGVHEPGPALTLMVNDAAYQDLPDDLKTIVQQAAERENGRMIMETAANNARALKALVKDHGVILGTFPDEIIKAFLEVSEQVVKETADKTEIGKRIYDSWYGFRSEMLDYNPYAEFGYARFRDQALKNG